MQRKSRRKPKWWKTAANWGGYGLLWLISHAVMRLPFRAASALGELFGVLVYHLGREERNRALRHLRWAFGGTISRGERRRIAYDVFRNFGRAFTEALAGTNLSTEQLEALVENIEAFKHHTASILAEGKGLFGMTGHLGNWELAGTVTARYFPLSVVANRFRFEPYNRLAESMRAAGRLKVIYLNENPRDILRALKRNEIVAILPDQDIRRLPGTYALFFGRPAWTPVGPVLTAKASGSPMVPYFLVRHGMKYRLEWGERIPMEFTGDRRRDLYVNTQKWIDAYETFIRRYPGQWAWNHLRWNTRPHELPEGYLRHATLPSELRRGSSPVP
ncbi:MAG: lysophospholipid acyltransferase family protein [Planctomycetota bacterium]|jgi:KDO2-lipid IV(A) lauroyltransferase